MRRLLAVAAVCVSAAACAQGSTSVATRKVPGPLGAPGHWTLVFSDEFNDTTLDLSKWRPNWHFWAGGTDQSISKPVNDQHEVSCYDPAQVSEANGYLTLSAVARSCTADTGVTYGYASGLIQSANHFTFTYGFAEARLWIPPGSGTPENWPAFWTNGTGTPRGELDIVEALAGKLCWHIHKHMDATGENTSAGGCAAQSTGGWHVFGVDWRPARVTFYYDGVRVARITSNVPVDAQYLIAQLALSNSISPPVTAPSNLKVDYVRVWK